MTTTGERARRQRLRLIEGASKTTIRKASKAGVLIMLAILGWMFLLKSVS